MGEIGEAHGRARAAAARLDELLRGNVGLFDDPHEASELTGLLTIIHYAIKAPHLQAAIGSARNWIAISVSKQRQQKFGSDSQAIVRQHLRNDLAFIAVAVREILEP